jgi:hypothetical protein
VQKALSSLAIGTPPPSPLQLDSRHAGVIGDPMRNSHERTTMAFTELTSGSDEETEERGSARRKMMTGGLQF